VQQFVSADSFAASDRNEFDLFDHVEGDSSAFDRSNLEWLEGIGAIVLGANTYRMFASYWPTPQAEHEVIAPRINSLAKYVFSRSLAAAPWGDDDSATIASGDAPETIRRLKGELHGDLILWGSLSLMHSLFRARAVDLVRLVVLPVAIGSGRGVFPPGEGTTALRLIATKTLDTFVTIDYALRGAAG
jgi:dihydrofolate reductase